MRGVDRATRWLVGVGMSFVSWGCTTESVGGAADAVATTGADSQVDAAADAAVGPPNFTYLRNVAPLIAARCGSCHEDGGIAPLAFETYQQVFALKELIAAEVAARIMPPWHAAPECTDYKGDQSLTDDQISMISEWAAAGGPEGDPSETPVEVSATRLTLSRVDYELPIPTPYTPTTPPDDYRCFFLDWPATTTKYITGFGVRPDRTDMVHHAIAYLVRPDKIATFQALDDADDLPGWTCFGGPGGSTVKPGTVGWVGAWAPGTNGEDLPEGTGLEVPAGSKIIVQLHYNLVGVTPGPDQSSLLLRVADSVEKKAAIMPFADLDWMANGTMTIPARGVGVQHAIAMDPTEFVGLATAGAIPSGRPLLVYNAGLHMHTLGQRGVARIERPDGTNECLLDVPDWDFHWQSAFTFAEPKRIVPGDKIYLECEWDNPTDVDVGWGEGTSDEMCLGIYYVTEP